MHAAFTEKRIGQANGLLPFSSIEWLKATITAHNLVACCKRRNQVDEGLEQTTPSGFIYLRGGETTHRASRKTQRSSICEGKYMFASCSIESLFYFLE
jgi:hypothetical protein